MTPAELHEMAEMARNGLSNLDIWWDPDRGRDIDPMDDPETQAAAKWYIGQRWRELSRLRLASKPVGCGTDV